MELDYYFPPRIREALHPYLYHPDMISEIRFRIGKPVFCYKNGEEHIVIYDGRPFILTQEMMKLLMYHICQYSVYAYEEERKKGYMTLMGGHRVGLSGLFCWEDGIKRGIRDVSGMNFRISHEKKGIADRILPWCYEKGELLSVMIISPPGLGKTTLLRELIRNFSNGNLYGTGKNIVVIDERSEIGGSYQGIPQNDLGDRTDCLDSVSKKDGIWMAIRSLAPQMIAVDEIGGEKEDEELVEALYSGVKLLVTVHGRNILDVTRKYVGNRLLRDQMIERFVEIDIEQGKRKYHLIDETGSELEVVD